MAKLKQENWSVCRARKSHTMPDNIEIKEGDSPAVCKVLFVTHNYIRHVGDFAGVFLHLLARKLREKNIEVHVVAPHDAGLAEFEETLVIKIHRFRYASDENETFAYRGDMHRQLFRNPFKYFRLRKFLKESFKLACRVIDEENIQIVHVHWIVPNGIVGKKLKNKYGDRIKLILSSHGTDVRLLTGFPMVYSFMKDAVKKCDCWTVVSSFLKNLIIEKDSSVVDKIKIVPLPNDETIFYPDGNILEDSNLVVAVSRLTVQKRLDYLLDAIKLAQRDIPNIKLDIYGAGPEKQNLENRISQLGLEGRIRIMDPVPQKDLRRVYNHAAVVVLNSYREGFGLALTEAMLCRTAVIGTESGGITDIIENEVTGLLVPEDNSEKLAEAIVRILKDHSLRKRLADAGFENARVNFSSGSSAINFARLYESL